MKLTQKSCKEFTDLLASKEAVPGGGGAVALAGAIGVALNSMVANFSIGKKKYKDVEEKHKEILFKGCVLRNQLIELIDADAENFLPLSKAYGMKSTTDEERLKKEEVLQKALKVASAAPIKMVECIYESILLHEELVDISSKLIISDIGVGIQCLKAALYGAQLNVMININAMEDKGYALSVKRDIDAIVLVGSKIADEVYGQVLRIMSE